MTRRITLSFLFLLSLCFISLFSYEIDVVYTWVDGRDEAWQKERAKWLHITDPHAPMTVDASSARRFRDREELKYSLRSLLQFAPFIHHIYIVTCDQKPKWIQEHPKITFVSHREIFSKQEHLPTFNSMAIESNLHHIKGLSEYYLYFNDDVFLTQPVTPDDFFTETGKMRLFFSTHELPKGPPYAEDNGFVAASKNTSHLLSTIFGNEKRFFHSHTPFSCRVSASMLAEAMFPEVFATVSSHRFRSKKDFTMTNGVIPYVALYHGKAVPSPVDSKTWCFGTNEKKDRQIAKELFQTPPKFLCIQDSLQEGADADEVALFLQHFLSQLFPTPAPWESIVDGK